jgi:hypothetical protein
MPLEQSFQACVLLVQYTLQEYIAAFIGISQESLQARRDTNNLP